MCLTDRGLKFSHQPKVQHVARASTSQQSKALKLPPLVPSFSSKLVTMFKDNDMVWPLNKIDLSSLKLLHEFEFGGIVNAKQLSAESEAKQKLQTELSVWGISLVLDEFAGFEFDLNKAKVFGVQWGPQQFLEKACAVIPF